MSYSYLLEASESGSEIAETKGRFKTYAIRLMGAKD